MKRLHLFELEDQRWFPGWLRQCMTRLMVVMHRLLRSSDGLSELVGWALLHSGHRKIIDLCSGSGGAMLEVLQILRQREQFKNVELVLTDLNPDMELAQRLNLQQSGITYLTDPVDATRPNSALKGLRTMVGSMHHMRPSVARKILKEAMDDKQPICVFEISDNSLPSAFWWIALPINFVMTFFITPLARPLTWRQIFFTYVIPILPAAFAWDGAVSNARTYTVSDMDELTEGLESDDYRWERGQIDGRMKQLYLLGLPSTQQRSETPENSFESPGKETPELTPTPGGRAYAFLLLVVIGGLSVIGTVALTNWWVLRAADGRVSHRLADLEAHDVGLVLGTSPFLRRGWKNPFFEARMNAAALLFHEGKVRHLLVSGDNGQKEYNEPTAMRDALVARGVPAEAVTLDYAGFRTLDSVERARTVFGLKEAVIVTDDFHLPRSLFLARAKGLKAVGYRPEPVPWKFSKKTRTREAASRLKAWLDVYVLGTKPRFGGPPEKIRLVSAK